MKIVCDIGIPFLLEAVARFWPEVEVAACRHDEIDRFDVQDADVLVVRTRTRVDESLLAGSSVQLVCTATIGFDHIDTAYCESHNIRWAACPGCNAQAVCDYVEEVLTELKDELPPQDQLTIGIVGVGHVGSLVLDMATRHGMHTVSNDPPRNLEAILDYTARVVDVLTFHVPLNATTRGLCDERLLSLCKPDALIINSSRGGVVDEEALLRSGRPYVLDTWINEPKINLDVLSHARLASMHIAGYSLRGKINATQMCLNAIARQFDLEPVVLPLPSSAPGDSRPGWLQRITDQLKAHPEQFESMRTNYLLR